MENSKFTEKFHVDKKCLIWKRRTLLERCLMLICVLLFIVFIVMSALLIRAENSRNIPKKNVCLNNMCKREAGSILMNMDLTVDPCENFYEFSCGSYMKYKNIYDNEISSLKNLKNYMLLLAKEELQKQGSLGDPPFVDKVRKYYVSCLNKPTDLKIVIKQFLNATQLDGWPLSKNDASTLSIDNAVALSVALRGTGVLFKVYTQYNSSSIKIRGGDVTIKARILLNQTIEEHIKVKGKYIHMMEYVLGKMGLSEKDSKKHIEEMIQFETSLAKVKEMKRQDNATNTTFTELQSLCPQIQWKNIFKSLYEHLDHPEEYHDENQLQVMSMNYTMDLCHLVENTDIRIVYNLLVWNTFIKYLGYFDYMFGELILDIKDYMEFKFESKYVLNKLKWKSCIGDMDTYVRFGLDYMMLMSIDRDKDIKEVKSYVEEMSQTLEEIFYAEDWFDDYSKNITKIKLNSTGRSVGYSNISLDMDFLNHVFQDLIVTDSYIENIVSAAKNEFYDGMFNQTILSLIRDNNHIDPFEAGASYGGLELEGIIEMPLGIMYPPFYAYGLPKYLHYSGIGMAIAHEFSHAFDHLDYYLQMRKANITNERLVVKFPDEFLEEFKRRKDCFVDQYSQFPLEGNLTINGKKTIGDNIADNSGITVAYRAYKRYLKNHGEEPNLPGLDYSNKQMFYIGYAQLWCQSIESMKKAFEKDVHSPGRYRVLVPLMNSPEFSKVFSCRSKSYMNPEHKCRMWG